MKATGTPWQAISLLALILSGCTSTSCDPARAGFIESLNCDASGGFDARQAGLQRSLAGQQTQEGFQKARADQSARDAAAAKADLAKRRTELADLDKRLSSLQRDLDRELAKGTANKADLERAEREMSSIQAARNHVTSTDPSHQDLDQLMSRQDRLLELLRSME